MFIKLNLRAVVLINTCAQPSENIPDGSYVVTSHEIHDFLVALMIISIGVISILIGAMGALGIYKRCTCDIVTQLVRVATSSHSS